jgi:carboxypeptidase PM20D1
MLGALESAKWFQARGQKFDWIMDEGTPIGEDQIKGVDSLLGLVSVEEKGYLSLNLSVAQEPGHSSQPPRIQAVAVLARALHRISNRPFPFRLNPSVEMFFKQLSPYMSGIQRFVLRHARALGPLFFKLVATSPAIEAMVRTTIAMTQLEGSAADNVMPSEARAVLNLRLLWPMTVEKAISYIEKAINDARVKVSVIHGLGSDPVASSGDFRTCGWPEIQAAMSEAWPGVPVFPFIMIGLTDSHHFKEHTGGIFRYSPFKMNPKDLEGVHGHDERVSVENLHRALSIYSKLLESL